MSTFLPIVRDDRIRDLEAAVGQQVFTFDAPLFDAADLWVGKRVGSAARFAEVTSGYTVALLPADAGATVTFAAPPRVSSLDPVTTIRLKGARHHERITDVTRGGAIRGAALEGEFDRQSVVLGELRRDVDEMAAALPADLVDRALRVPDGETIDPLPPVADLAGAILGFDASSRPIAVPAGLPSGIVPAPGRRLRGCKLGQSTARDGQSSGGVTSPIPAGSRFWSGKDMAWVALAPGAGGAAAADLTTNRLEVANGTHALYSMTDRLVNGLGYEAVDWIASWRSGVSLSQWVGTPADRAVTSENRPMYVYLLRDFAAAFGLGTPLDVLVISHGQADYSDEDYLDERNHLLECLELDNIIGSETIIIHEELLIAPEHRLLNWVQNRVINFLPWSTARRNQVVVPTLDLEGYDDGSVYPSVPDAGVETVQKPWRQHFTAAASHEKGLRGADAFGSALLGLTRGQEPWVEAINVRGRSGFVRGHFTRQTTDAPSVWDVRNCQGSLLRVIRDDAEPDAVCDITIGDVTWREGSPYAGATFRVWVETNARLILRSGYVNRNPKNNFADMAYSRSATPTLEISATGGPVVLDLIWDGYYWRTHYVMDRRAGSGGGVSWNVRDGRLEARGTVTLATALEATASIVFPADMPAISASYTPIATMGADPINIGSAGFDLVRRLAVTVPSGGGGEWLSVKWALSGAPLINGAS